MRRGAHPNQQSMRISDLSGGVNVSVPPDLIGANEVSMADNWEYDILSPLPRVRPGLGATAWCDTEMDKVDTLFYSPNREFFLCSDGTTLKKAISSGATGVGTLAGAALPVYTLWGDANDILIASGGNLQKYDGTTLVKYDGSGELDTSPECDIVYVQYGRAVVAKTGTEKLHLSGVGDPGNWTASGDDDYQYINIGYKDGNTIRAFLMLSNDLIIFKSPEGDDTKGIIYRLVGGFPDWSIKEISRDSHTFSQNTVAPLGDDVFYLDKRGLRSLGTVATYGDVKMASQGDKLGGRLSQGTAASSRVWHIPQKGQVWVKTGAEQGIWVFSYTHQAWTSFSFPATVTPLSVATDGINVYCGCNDGKIYKMDDLAGKDATFDVKASLRYRQIRTPHQIAITEFGMRAKGQSTGTGTMQVGNDSFSFSFETSGDIAYDDDDIAYDDTDYPVIEAELRRIKRTGLRGFEFTPQIAVNSGKMELKEIWVNFAEV